LTPADLSDEANRTLKDDEVIYKPRWLMVYLLLKGKSYLPFYTKHFAAIIGMERYSRQRFSRNRSTNIQPVDSPTEGHFTE
jgi:hypothetical protein